MPRHKVIPNPKPAKEQPTEKSVRGNRPKKTRAYVEERRKQLADEALEVVRKLKEIIRQKISETRLEPH